MDEEGEVVELVLLIMVLVGQVKLKQIFEFEGVIVVFDLYMGCVFVMMGGYFFFKSFFN